MYTRYTQRTLLKFKLSVVTIPVQEFELWIGTLPALLLRFSRDP
jgi:hypothetical protein